MQASCRWDKVVAGPWHPRVCHITWFAAAVGTKCVRSVDAEWITARKDWEEAKRKYKAQQARQSSKDGNGAEPGSAAVNDTPQMEAPEEQGEEGYLPDMDEMRCILYAHGGEYMRYYCICSPLNTDV